MSTTRYGITLAVQIPRTSYPRNALVQTRVTVTNHTRQLVQLGHAE